ncbi:MAG: helix-hairpin-helix domain-containing protein [Planctomycetes bacterium]|nr:helix-hairpin-helix domain-containing protein [Planctomycetota bacterium]
MNSRTDDSMKSALRELQTIPGVGPSIARDLYDLGYRKVSDLKRQDPQKMYDRSCELQGVQIDRCLLYVYRCAVYYAGAKKHDPEKLKWWNWKDQDVKKRVRRI